jgi:cytochrome c
MKCKRTAISIILVLIVAALIGLIVWFVSKQEESRLIKSGEGLAFAHCARCHAVGRSGISPIPAAPIFRTLFRRYPAESLVESLGEGLTSRHPDMPMFVFSANEVAAIMSYLDSIQEP